MVPHAAKLVKPLFLRALDGAPGLAGVPLLTFDDLVWFAAVWAVVAAVAAANSGWLSAQPLRRQAA